MRKSERGDGEILLFFLIVVIVIIISFNSKGCADRSATASCLKQQLALEHDMYTSFDKDEAETLAPTVKAKLDELWNAKNKARQTLEQASSKDRQKCLEEYQAARSTYQCFDNSIRAFGLWPPPEHPTAEATPSAK